MRLIPSPVLAAVLATVVCAPAIMLPATALGSTRAPKGMLTSIEYRQLSTEQAAFRRLEHRRRATWNELYAVCRTVGQSTALLKSVRSNVSRPIQPPAARSWLATLSAAAA